MPRFPILSACALFGALSVIAPVMAPAAHAAPCSSAPDMARVFAIQARLEHDPAPADHDPDDISPTQQQEIPHLREAFANAVTRYLQCDAAAVTDVAAIQAGLAERLHAGGDALSITATQPAGLEGTVAVTTTFALGCGSDTVLTLFRRQPTGWQPILSWYSKKFTALSDAFNDFYGYIVTPGPDGAKLVAVAHTIHGCTSRWAGLTIDLLAPATAENPQKLLDSADIGLYDTQDEAHSNLPSLTPRADGFTFRAGVMSRDVDNIFSYTGVFRYRTLDGRLERQPAASNARDFVDSWLSESWPTASRWSGPSQASLHNGWSWLSLSDKSPNIAFGPVRACSQNGQFQVQMDLTQQGSPASPPHAYAKLFQGNGSFTMLAISPVANADCTGPDLMAKRK